ncbi:formyl-CoA transferase [Williamsia limnetica]|uniref:Formyl-CoA transferase n=1 Tax=Williamsia limnetica TaxID=882452 RepID=A0A318RCM8_WILLI|nr:CoA transferase [Williamsia limnetica]PYE12456.1 formyl-CoA transferase [Williamsia limnetica]
MTDPQTVSPADEQASAAGKGPLRGVKVVEFAQVIAGPLAGTLMADLGAEVVHVEAPLVGDNARHMGPAKDGHHLWWKVLGRNKRSVTLDLGNPDARSLTDKLVQWADVVIVTFRSSTVKRFGLDWATVSTTNPSAILLQISGYGANTSNRDEPGFGKMGEARSGLVHLTGFEDGAPIHTGFSHGDATTGLMGAFAVSAALVRRNAYPERKGEWIDLALFETLFRLVEWQVIIHDQLGAVPQRSGNSLAVAPAAVINTYRSADDEWITVTSGTLRSVLNIVRLLGLDEAEYSTREAQHAGRGFLDQQLAVWISERSTSCAVEALQRAKVVASKIYDIEDIFADQTYRERDDIVTVTDADLGDVRMQGVIPHFAVNPGAVWRTGAALGEDNDLVFGEWLDLDDTEMARLHQAGVIGD